MESLEAEVAPFGVPILIVNPGFFRTELLTKELRRYVTDLAEGTVPKAFRTRQSGLERSTKNR